MPFPTTKHLGFISEYPGNGTHCPAAVQYFQANLPNGVDANGVTQYKVFDIATKVAFYSYLNDLSVGSEMVMDPGNLTISSANATLNNVSVWSANSILTQGRGDGRYVPKACGTSYFAVYDGTIYVGNSNSELSLLSYEARLKRSVVGDASHQPVGGEAGIVAFQAYDGAYSKPYLALSGSIDYYYWADDSILCRKYADSRYIIASNYTPYSLPTATNTTLGGIKVGANLSISNGVLSATSSGGGFQSGDIINGGTY